MAPSPEARPWRRVNIAAVAAVAAAPSLALAWAPASARGSQEEALPDFCDVAAVGGGWAGIYFAFRIATASEGNPGSVCLFEATHRIGGRTYSHTLQAGSKSESFTIDVGAYRFSPDMHLPGDIILKVLKLPVACYEPDCEPASKDLQPPFHLNYSAPLVRIVDEHKQPAGYVKALEGMLDRFEAAGGRVFLGAKLTEVHPTDGSVELTFASTTKVVRAKQVLLNLPRPALLALPSMLQSTKQRTLKALQCVKFDLPSSMFPPGALVMGHSLTKAYAFYEEAWWHTRLNMTEGQLPANAFLPIVTSQGIPIGIHFNDGPVHCDAPLKGCRGFLEVFYSPFEESFFQDLRPSPEEPLGMLSADHDSEGKLKKLHAAVMEVMAKAFTAKGVDPPTEPPSLLAVGVWARGPGATGYTAPTKVYYSSDPSVPGGPDPLERACGVEGLTQDEYRESVISPLGDPRVLVANNDWVASRTEDMYGDWAEESLLMAERALRRLSRGRPEWLDKAYYEDRVARFVPALEDESIALVV